MSEAFEIGVTLALSDGVSESIAQARRDMAAFERTVTEGGVSVDALRRAAAAAVSQPGRPFFERATTTESSPASELTEQSGNGWAQASTKAADLPLREASERNPILTLPTADSFVAVAREMKSPDQYLGTQSILVSSERKPNGEKIQEGLSVTPGAPLPYQPVQNRLASQEPKAEPTSHAPAPVPPSISSERGSAADRHATPSTPSGGSNFTATWDVHCQNALVPEPQAPKVTLSDQTETPIITEIPNIQASMIAASSLSKPGGPWQVDPQATPMAPSGRMGFPTDDGQSRSNDLGAGGAVMAPMEGDVFLDGALVGRWMSRYLAQEAGRASAGPTGFDPRRSRLLPGAAVTN